MFQITLDVSEAINLRCCANRHTCLAKLSFRRNIIKCGSVVTASRESETTGSSESLWTIGFSINTITLIGDYLESIANKLFYLLNRVGIYNVQCMIYQSGHMMQASRLSSLAQVSLLSIRRYC